MVSRHITHVKAGVHLATTVVTGSSASNHNSELFGGVGSDGMSSELGSQFKHAVRNFVLASCVHIHTSKRQ